MRRNVYWKFVIFTVFFSVVVFVILDEESIDAKLHLVTNRETPKLFKKSTHNLQNLIRDALHNNTRQSDNKTIVSLDQSSVESMNVSLDEKHSDTVTLFLSGGERGYLKPCGCSEGQVGGISRRNSLLTMFREQGISVIPIANGNLIFEMSRQSEIKADIGFFALADMGYIAYNVGQYDLQLGVEHLASLSEQNKLPLLSANLYRGTSPVFEPYILHTVDLPERKITIAVIGLISPNHAIFAQNLDLKIVDPQGVLKPLIPTLREAADVIVCLFNGTTAEATVLRNSFTMLDVIVLSNEKTDKTASSLLPHPLVNTDVKGKAIFSMDINLDNSGKFVVKKAERHLLDEKIPDSPDMIQLLELYKEMLSAEDLVESSPHKQQKAGPQFVGNAACKTCHIDEWKSWKETKHAHAYHTLEVAGHETDPECLTCHTVGFGATSGFVSIEKTPNHVDVGCENCHGAGSTHVEHPEQKDYGTIKKAFCVTCHTAENSPKFDIEVYFPKILHSSSKSSVMKKTQ